MDSVEACGTIGLGIQVPPDRKALGLLLASAVSAACLCGREVNGVGDGGPAGSADGGSDVGSHRDGGTRPDGGSPDDGGVVEDGGTEDDAGADGGLVRPLCLDGGSIALGLVWSADISNMPSFQASPAAVAADFDGDGRLDLGLPYTGSIHLALGDGRGGFSFGSAVIEHPGPRCDQLLVGDFNGDGYPDIACCGESAQIFLGDGHGAFDAGVAVSLATGNGTCQALVGRDLNGDGWLDLAAVWQLDAEPSAPSCDGGCIVDLMYGDGRGNLSAPIELGVSSTDWPSALAVEDFDGDGYLDIVVGGLSSSILGERRGLSDGGFSEEGFIDASLEAWGWGVGDLNGDGLPDLVLSDGSFAVVLAQSDGGFLVGTVPTLVEWDSTELTLYDVNGDGIPDLISRAGDPTRTSVETIVALGDGDGGFAAPLGLPGGYSIYGEVAPVVAPFLDDGGIAIVFPDVHFIDAGNTSFTLNSVRVERCPPSQ